jgi:hypothetical protein
VVPAVTLSHGLWAHPVRLLVLAMGILVTSSGCGGPGVSGDFKLVHFEAPSYPDAKLREVLDSVEAIGVVSATNVEPLQGLDTEKIMGRLTDATASSLRQLPDHRVVTNDEIRWHFRGVVFDSASVRSPETRAALRREMDIDAVVLVTLKSFEAQMTTVTPTQYGLTPATGMNISVDLKLSLINLDTGLSWSHTGRQRDWKPMQGQLLGGSNRMEQQLLTALGQPLRHFLSRVAPPPSVEDRLFDLSGD